MKKIWEEAGLLPLWRLNDAISADTPNVTGVTNMPDDENDQSISIMANENSDKIDALDYVDSPVSFHQKPETLSQLKAVSSVSVADNTDFDALTMMEPTLQIPPENIPQVMPFDTMHQSDSPEPHLTDEPQWERLETEVVNCRKCNLCLKRTKTVFGVGDRHPEWLFVGEGPGAEEDIKGEPFVGQAGRLLDIILESLKMSRQHGVYIANAVKCRPPENRKPLPDEMGTCFPYLEQQIHWLKPKIIIALGATGAQALLQCDTPIGKLRGKKHTYRGIPVVATYHPAYLLRSPQEKAKVWQDLVFAKRIYKQVVEENY